MADDIRSSQPIPPGSHVAVFLDEAASGATIGHHGTLLGVCFATTRCNPQNPDEWQYRIHVPALGRIIAVEAKHFLVTRTVDGQLQLVSAAEIAHLEALVEPWELRFACPVGDDNLELFGHYRFGQCERGLFHFRKYHQIQPAYQFRLPTRPSGSNRGRLAYHVPEHDVLNRGYVLRALVSVLGCHMPADAHEPD